MLHNIYGLAKHQPLPKSLSCWDLLGDAHIPYGLSMHAVKIRMLHICVNEVGL
jgi:hypothetical protein